MNIITQPSVNDVNVYFLRSHESLNYCPGNSFLYIIFHIDCVVSRFAVKNTQALIDMHDDDARTVRL